MGTFATRGTHGDCVPFQFSDNIHDIKLGGYHKYSTF